MFIFKSLHQLQKRLNRLLWAVPMGVALAHTPAAHAATAFLQGEATYLARVMPPPDAVLVVTLEDVSRAGAPSREVASQRISLKGGPPYSWRIAYDPAMLEGPSHALRARIEVAGQLWMSTDTRYPAFGPGAQAQPELVLRMVGSTASAPAATGCANANTQAALNDCASQDFLAAGADYGASYQALSARLSAGSKTALRSTQKAWLAYRTAACSFESSGLQGGSAQAMVRSQCAARMTRARAAELGRLARCTEGDLSCVR
jgi:uncharacterized lipoprotein YbaY